ncbi:MAG: 4Fe-4S binding protein [Candidatus Omnitrophica bacterium]|nr:4Fe-4S binding protein [Candidatus Omnitrophota bacterium]
MKKALLVDLDLYVQDKDGRYGCDYFYHSPNYGVRSLLELVTYAVICRRCELASCIEACPNDALDRGEDKILKKYNMRCTSCKSCSHACPFGVIFPEMVPYLVGRCDFCLDRIAEGESPECARSSKDGVLKYGDFEEDKRSDIYSVSKNILVKARHWERDGKKVCK